MKKLLIIFVLVLGFFALFATNSFAQKKTLVCFPLTQTVGTFNVVEVQATTNVNSTNFVAPSYKDYKNFVFTALGGNPSSSIYGGVQAVSYIFYTSYSVPGTYTITVTDAANGSIANCTVNVQ